MLNDTADLPNARRLEGEILSAGQPTQAHLEAARNDGVRTVINLRPDGEFSDFDEAAQVREAGMHYVHIPVAGPDDINRSNAQRLHDALTGADATPALVHCASGNRVGALMAYRARHFLNHATADALRIGADAGLNPKSPLFKATRQKLD